MDRIAIAFDRGGVRELRDLVIRGKGLIDYVKLGPSVLLRLGSKAIELCLGHGVKVFLDLKLHDIPFQVSGAIHEAVNLGVSIVTVHDSGGSAMLGEAVAGRKGSDLKIIGVNLLTSLTDEDVKGIYNTTALSHAKRLTTMARDRGLDGVVCSGLELQALRKGFPRPFMLVVPGLRFKGDSVGDQRRVIDPYEAVKLGADLLVLGRSVTATPGGWQRLRELRQWLNQQNI